jgi:sigma54-dependent transcription regulator
LQTPFSLLVITKTGENFMIRLTQLNNDRSQNSASIVDLTEQETNCIKGGGVVGAIVGAVKGFDKGRKDKKPNNAVVEGVKGAVLGFFS